MEEEGSPTANEESTKKRRKETEADTYSSTSTCGNTTIATEDKDLSPMEEETTSASASTSNFTTTNEDDIFTETKSALNNLPFASPTLTTSGLNQVFATTPDLNLVGENTDLHHGLIDERDEIGETPKYRQYRRLNLLFDILFSVHIPSVR